MEVSIQYRYDLKYDEWIAEHTRKGVLCTMSGKYVRENMERLGLSQGVTFRLLVAELLLVLFEYDDNPMSDYVLTRAFKADSMERVISGLHDER